MRRSPSYGKLAPGLLFLALAGCVSYEPRPIEPAQTAASIEQRSLDDPALLAFVEEYLPDAAVASGSKWDEARLTLAAFYFNPDLDVARAQWSAAEAAQITAGARPDLAVNAASGRNSTTTTPSPTITTADIDLTLRTSGKRRYRAAQAAQLAEAARLSLGSVAWDVRSRVRSALLALYGAGESATLLAEQQKIHSENVGIRDEQYRAGAISAFERTQARLAADNSRLALHDARRREAEALVELADAIGLPASSLANVAISLESFGRVPPAQADAFEQALLHRADILGALAEYAASQSALQLEIAKQYPDIHLGPGYEFDQGDKKWSLGLGIALPANRNRGPIAEALAQRDEAAARFDALQTRVLGQVDLALAAYSAAADKQADANRMLADVEQQEAIAEGMLEAGAISRSDLAALQLELSASTLTRLEALVQAQQAAGQLQDVVQAPLDVSSAAWERSPRARSTEGTDSP